MLERLWPRSVALSRTPAGVLRPGAAGDSGDHGAVPRPPRHFRLPLTRFLQFNPHVSPLRNRELRQASGVRAFPARRSSAIPPPRSAAVSSGRVSHCCSRNPSASQGDFPGGAEYDVPTAIAMSLAAHQLGNGRSCRCCGSSRPENEVERAACEAARAGLETGRDSGRDRFVGRSAGRRPNGTSCTRGGPHRADDRSGPSSPPAPWPRIADLDHLPAWLRHDLIELDRITDSSRASEFARGVLRKVLADCARDSVVGDRFVPGRPQEPSGTCGRSDAGLRQPGPVDDRPVLSDGAAMTPRVLPAGGYRRACCWLRQSPGPPWRRLRIRRGRAGPGCGSARFAHGRADPAAGPVAAPPAAPGPAVRVPQRAGLQSYSVSIQVTFSDSPEWTPEVRRGLLRDLREQIGSAAGPSGSCSRSRRRRGPVLSPIPRRAGGAEAWRTTSKAVPKTRFSSRRLDVAGAEYTFRGRPVGPQLRDAGELVRPR